MSDDMERHLSRGIVPTLLAHADDEGLRDDWLEDEDYWLPEALQLGYLIVLVRDLGPRDRLDALQRDLHRLVEANDADAKRVVTSGVLDTHDP
jgi:hypothetical protein